VVRPGFVSPSTESVGISVNGEAAETDNLGPEVPGCESISADELACTIPIDAPLGEDTFTVKLWDARNGSGNLLGVGTGTTDVSVVPSQFPITVQGVVKTIQMQPLSSPSSGPCGAGQQDPATVYPILITVLDADHNKIVGDGTYYNSITLTDSDTSGSTRLSTSVITSASVNANFSWSGGDLTVYPTIEASAESGGLG
jgi:hypothetical protein